MSMLHSACVCSRSGQHVISSIKGQGRSKSSPYINILHAIVQRSERAADQTLALDILDESGTENKVVRWYEDSGEIPDFGERDAIPQACGA